MSFIDQLILTSNKPDKAKAFADFKDIGIPTTRNEEWKFTNIARVLKNDFSTLKPSITQEDIKSIINDDLEGNKIIIINGIYQDGMSQIISDNIHIESIKTALTSNSIAKTYYGKSLKNKDAFTSLNFAFSEDGFFIHIEKNKTVSDNTIVYFISDARKQNIISYPHNLIVAEENSEANITMIYRTIGENKSFINELTEISIAKNARLNYYKIQNDNNQASQVGTTQVTQAEKSFCYANVFSTSGEIIRNNLNITLNGEYIESHMNGLYMLEGNTHVDNHTIADHKFPNCESHELYKGIMDDKSNGVFNGKIFVRQDAQKTNAFQANNNILLSDSAKINAKPQLEIWADDVSCSHGCTIGQLDSEALFYLQSRGVSANKAKALLVEAFANQVVEKIKISDLQENIKKTITNRLA